MDTHGTPAEPLRVAAVGCGRRFRTSMLPVLLECGAELVAVVDPDRGTRDKVVDGLSGRYAPATAEDLSTRVLRDAVPDTVLVASPSGLHFEHVRLALAAGVPTFVEKPLARSAREARQLRRMGGDRLATSEQRVHRTDLRYARALMASGGLGRIRRVTYRDTVAPAPSFADSWRNDPVLAGGGVLFDLGYHTVNTVQWLLDSPCHDLVVSFVRLHREPFAVEDTACVRGSTAGVELRLFVGMDAAHPGEELRVLGTKAELRVVRGRLTGSCSTVEVHSPEDGTLTTRHAIGDAHDTRSLRKFLAGEISAASLDRHVATVQLLERFYKTADGRNDH